MSKPESIYDALVMVKLLKEFCATSLGVGTGIADKGVTMCVGLEDLLFEEADVRRKARTVLPSKKEYCP